MGQGIRPSRRSVESDDRPHVLISTDARMGTLLGTYGFEVASAGSEDVYGIARYQTGSTDHAND